MKAVISQSVLQSMINMVKRTTREGNIKITVEGPASAFRKLESPKKGKPKRKTARVRVVHR